VRGAGVAEAQLDFVNDVRTGDLGSSRVTHDRQGDRALGWHPGCCWFRDHGGGRVDRAGPGSRFRRGHRRAHSQDEGEEYTGARRPQELLAGRQDGSRPAERLQNTLIRDVAALGMPMAVVLKAERDQLALARPGSCRGDGLVSGDGGRACARPAIVR